MASRREFIQSTIAISALPLLDRTASAETARVYGKGHISRIVFNQEFAPARAFADEARRLGISADVTGRDITDLWNDDLSDRWRAGPMPLAGMTTSDSIFCLEQLAWTRRLRVVFRAEHIWRENGVVEHRLSGIGSLVKNAELEKWGNRWTVRIAQLFAESRPQSTNNLERSEAVFMTRGCDFQSEPLVSWIIAPKLQDEV